MARKKKPEPTAAVSMPETTRCPVAGIGASAGGFEALKELVAEIPPNTGIAFVVIQHLDPKHSSLLASLLARETTLPVREVVEQMTIEPNHVYVISRNTLISVEGDQLKTEVRHPAKGPFLPVDTFFRSLAKDRETRAVGVVLSGALSDGALGLKAIKAEGGVTFAQDPATARYEGMPRSAIAAGAVDFVLSPAEIGRELVRVTQHPYTSSVVRAEDEPLAGTDDDTSQILHLIRKITGVDFTLYKSTTVDRRIQRRMLLLRFETARNYLEYLRSNRGEVSLLYDDILINVTEFFRDPEVFAALSTVVFPQMIQAKGAHESIRVWVPGCSTGEEVYSIAITLLETLEERGSDLTVQIFGTDISDRALQRARAGIFVEGISQNVSAERLGRFFKKAEPGYQITKRVRELCIFAKHNLGKDPPFSKLDLISCRNVLIYMAQPMQSRVVPVFHYALNPAGVLLLGTSETIGSYSNMFTLIDKKNKIYSRQPAQSYFSMEWSMPETAPRSQRPPSPVPVPRTAEWTEADLQREADRLMLSRYAPPGVIVNEKLEILHFRGKTSEFLEAAQGAASFNLLKMAREGLTGPLRSAVLEAKRDRLPVRREGLRRRDQGKKIDVNVEVIPLIRGSQPDAHYLIIFERAKKGAGTAADELQSVKNKPRVASTVLEQENAQLTQELAANRAYLQSIIAEQEAANEALGSANEEIQSSNEELQSTNEELETAKEELQSTNEELNTLNEELQNRNIQLTQTSNDLNNLLSNVSIPIVMLANDLRIRKFTPASERILNLIETDVGRPISDIKSTLEIPGLTEMMLDVIKTLTPKHLRVKDRSGKTYSLRIRPYRTEDNKIDGIVMVLVDQDSAKEIEDSGLVEFAGSNEDRALADKQDRDFQGFAAALLQAQEYERRRLSAELHDELNQSLALLEMETTKLLKGVRPSDAATRKGLEDLRKKVAGLGEEVHRIAKGLHPSVLDDLGVAPALANYCAEVSRRDGMQVTFQHDGVPNDLNKDVALSIYRVVQEGVRNAAVHSGAGKVSVLLKFDGEQLWLSVSDNGVGFDPQRRRRAGLGLIGIHERIRIIGGTCEVTSAPGKGTRISASVPIMLRSGG